jgi:hypothetical protein
MFPTTRSDDCYQGFTNDPISPLCTNLPENDPNTSLMELPYVPHQSSVAFGSLPFDSTFLGYSGCGSCLSPIPELGQNGWNEYESLVFENFGSSGEREDSLGSVLDAPSVSHDPAELPLSWRYEPPGIFRDFQNLGDEDCTETSSTLSYGTPQIPSSTEVFSSWASEPTSILHGRAHSLSPNHRGKARTSSSGRHKRYQCSIPGCESRFVHQFDLARHEKSVHMKQEAGEGYRCASRGCKKADKIWTRLDNFKGHLARKHGNEDIEQLVQESTRSNHGLRFVVNRIPVQSESNIQEAISRDFESFVNVDK